MINITGLWKHESKSGKTFLSGSWGNIDILIFENENKKPEKAPDFNFCISEKKKEDYKSNNQQQNPFR